LSSIAIVILNWNGKHFLEQFLQGVVDHSIVEGHTVDVVVADNVPTDDSLVWLAKEFPTLRTIVHEQNHGFSGGYNLALKQIDADYYLLLNSDVQVEKGWLEPMILFMESKLNVAACMPKMLNFNEPNRFEYAGASGGFVDFWGYPFCRGRILNITEVDTGQYDDAREIFLATGACMLVRRKSFWEVGGFDNDFFAHMEEIDLCWRLKRRDYTIWVVPQSRVFHVGGGTLPKDNPRKVYFNHRNNLTMLMKNLSRRSLIQVMVFRLILDLASAAGYALSGKINFSVSVFKAHFNFFLHLRKTIRKRRKDKAQKVSLYPHSILFQFFVKRRQNYSQLPDFH